MNLTSIPFLIFFSFSLIVYLSLPKKVQWIWLLIVNILFYVISAPVYTFVYLLISAISIYGCTTAFSKVEHKKLLMVVTLLLNLAILAVLKYANLALTTLAYFLEIFNIYIEIPTINWISSLGISFYTLQMISYLMDCYWGVTEPETNFLKLLVFETYFPQMISGPISRYKEIGQQLFEEHRFDYDRISYGILRIFWGIFEKRVISDRLALIVDTIYSNFGIETGYVGAYIWIAILLFPLQLYTDFCGCMDIVLGVSECFGIRLPENFKAPFFSKNMQEFWRRWHITLGVWLKNYVMNPILKSNLFINMSANLKKRLGKLWGKRITTYIAMLVLWFCMGLWHGSGWKYIIGEGLWFWLVIVVGNILEPVFKKIYEDKGINTDTNIFNICRIIWTYFLYSIGMIFFRADSILQAKNLIICAFSKFNINIFFDGSLLNFGLSNLHYFILIIGLIALWNVDFRTYHELNVRDLLKKENFWGRWTLYWLMLLLIIISQSLSTQEFLYSQF